MAHITIAIEGRTDESVVRRLVSEAGHEVNHSYVLNGKAALDRSLRGYNHAARYAPWLVVRDLDHDADCAPTLIRQILPGPTAGMRLRIAVRAVEAWLMADRERFARFMSVPLRAIPENPEMIDDPKSTMITLARRSRARAIREDMVPAPGTTGRVGPAYPSRLTEFAATTWRPDVAAQRSGSLQRCLRCLREWQPPGGL